LNERLKQRLVGAVVLVSLAVIFIPMLLDGGEEGGMPLFGSNIPDKPNYRFEPLDIPLEPVEPVSEEEPVLVDKPEPAEEKPVEKKAASEQTAETEELVTKSDKPHEAAVERDTSEPKSDAVGWMVQVGSFSSSENAFTLRNKLRSKGFTTFVERLKANGNTVYRVRIGPELERAAAEAQLEKLQRQTEYKGIVMEHSS
jgi:DedD protein